MAEPEYTFRVVRTDYCYKPFGGMLQVGSRVLEVTDHPGMYMRETTAVLSLWRTTYEWTKRTHVEEL